MFFIKDYCYPEALFSRHVLMVFETSDIKLVRILIAIPTILIPKLKYNANTKVQNETLIYHTNNIIERLWPYLLNFFNYFYFLMHHFLINDYK